MWGAKTQQSISFGPLSSVKGSVRKTPFAAPTKGTTFWELDYVNKKVFDTVGSAEP